MEGAGGAFLLCKCSSSLGIFLEVQVVGAEARKVALWLLTGTSAWRASGWETRRRKSGWFLWTFCSEGLFSSRSHLLARILRGSEASWGGTGRGEHGPPKTLLLQ